MVSITEVSRPLKERIADPTAQICGSIAARIDRLPVSRELWYVMFMAGVAWLAESYDVGVISSTLPSTSTH